MWLILATCLLCSDYSMIRWPGIGGISSSYCNYPAKVLKQHPLPGLVNTTILLLLIAPAPSLFHSTVRVRASRGTPLPTSAVSGNAVHLEGLPTTSTVRVRASRGTAYQDIIRISDGRGDKLINFLLDLLVVMFGVMEITTFSSITHTCAHVLI